MEATVTVQSSGAVCVRGNQKTAANTHKQDAQQWYVGLVAAGEVAAGGWRGGMPQPGWVAAALELHGVSNLQLPLATGAKSVRLQGLLPKC